MILLRSMVARRLMASGLIVVVGMAVLTAVGLFGLRSSLIESRQQKLQETVAVARGSIDYYYGEAKKGVLSEEDAN